MRLRPVPIEIEDINPYKNDRLNRKDSVEFIKNIVTKAVGPLVLAVDAPWGTGKTTVLQILQTSLEADRYRCIAFNAWKADYSSDPLIAIIARLDEEVDRDKVSGNSHLKTIKRIASAVAKRGVIAAVKAGTLGALDLEEEIEAVIADSAGEAATDLVDLAKKEAGHLQRFREELGKLVQSLEECGHQGKLIFIVDELDRCRPTFAIELLERIKHLFDIPNVVFVLGIDKEQLEISTTAVYGAKINAREYLRRFIDLELSLPTVCNKEFIEQQIDRFELREYFQARRGRSDDLRDFIDFLFNIATSTGMTLRAQEQCIARLRVVIDQTPANYELFPVLVVILIIARTLNPVLFARLRTGQSSTEDIMEWLQEVGGEEFRYSRTARAVESYMNASDPDHKRKQVRMERVEKAAQDSESREGSYYADVARFTSRLLSSINEPDFDYVLKKVDLSGNLRR